MRINKFAKIAAGALGVCVLFIVALIVMPVRDAPLPDSGTSRVIANVRVVDVVAGTVGPPTTVLIRDGMVAAIGEAQAPADFPRMDAEGGYLVPAFWDMHVHTFQLSPQMHMPLWVANGVLNVRDMMGCPGASDSLIACVDDKRRWNGNVAAGHMSAPRIVEAASFYFEAPDMTPEQARDRASAYADRGVDALKVYNSLSPQAFAAVADEARAQRLRLVGHLPKAVALEDALVAGQASFEHAHILPRHCFAGAAAWREGSLDDKIPVKLTEAVVDGFETGRCDAAFDAMREAGAWLVPTHVTRNEDARAKDAAYLEDPRLDYLDPLSRWALGDDLGAVATRYPGARGELALVRYFEHGLKLTGRAHAAGVGVLVGTDSTIGGFRYHDEMANLVRAGMSPADVLRAATIDAARYSGMEATSGSIAPGKRADLVLLSANPLDDIAATRDIAAVVQGGRLYDRQRLDDLLAFTRDQVGTPHIWVKLVWGFARSSVSSEL